jgi:hypothetical protein
MAVLDATQRAEIRQALARLSDAIDYDKPKVNLAIQALEDWYENNKAGVSTAMNAATSPFVFSAAQKKKIGAYWFLQKAARELL